MSSTSNLANQSESTGLAFQTEALLAHALLKSLHHHLIRRHPRATCGIFLLDCWRKLERLAFCVTYDISVGLGAQRWAIDCARL